MKTFVATYFRGNPQFPNGGGYETTRTIQAKTIASARKLAREKESCVYGSMTLLSIRPAGEHDAR